MFLPADTIPASEHQYPSVLVTLPVWLLMPLLVLLLMHSVKNYMLVVLACLL